MDTAIIPNYARRRLLVISFFCVALMTNLSCISLTQAAGNNREVQLDADFHQPVGGFAMGGRFTLSAVPTQSPDQPSVRPSENIIDNTVGQMPDAPANTETIAFHLKELTINAAPYASERDRKLRKITAKYADQDIEFAQLQLAVSEITRHFRAHGYPAATAYLPPQETHDGAVQINVELGRFGTVSVENSSHLRTSVINRLIKGLKQGEIITNKKLETAVYNIIDLGGVKAGAIMRPGDKQGETNIIIRVEKGKRERYVLYAENYGSKTSGRYRYNFNMALSGLGGNSDSLSANLLVSNQHQHNYGVSYSLLTGRSGTKVGIGFSRTDYELGRFASSLGAIGLANTFSIFGSTPIWRTGNSGLNVTYGFDYRDLKDELRIFDYSVEKHSYIGRIGVNGFTRFPKAVIQYDLTGYTGSLTADDAHIGPYSFDISPQGRYSKLVFSATGVQTFDKRWDMVVRLQTQKAANPLDSSERMYLGGANGVRAYPQGEGAGDEGYQTTAELRYHTKIPGLLLSTYFDMGHVKYTKNNFPSGGTTLKGWGIGLEWSQTDQFFARLDYARRIGLADNASDDAAAKQRMWFIAGVRW